MRTPKHLGPWDLSVGSSLWAPGPPAQAQILIYTLGVRAGRRLRSQLSSIPRPPGTPIPSSTLPLSQFQIPVSRERVGCTLSSRPPSLSLSQVKSPSKAFSVQLGDYSGCRAILCLPNLSWKWDVKPRECQRLEEASSFSASWNLTPSPLPSWPSEKVGCARSSGAAAQTHSDLEAAITAACLRTSSCAPKVWLFISLISWEKGRWGSGRNE